MTHSQSQTFSTEKTKTIIVAKKVFQENDCIRNEEFFEFIKSHFDINRDIHFIDSKKREEFYNEHLKREGPSNAKTIQLKKWSDVIDLIKTLKYLKLNKCFKDIVEYAYPIFAKLEKKSSSDLHAAVTHCQINCLARKVTWILEFIEKQKLRLRMGIVDIPRIEYGVNRVAAESKQMGTSEKKQGAKNNTKKNNKPPKKK
ncbi:hypothetical protein GCK72_020816 [Caenorhabditis remanei]|uniref:Uncharacterized protein n=1 Tax=Caenorhabditis remanei TaxID=31234 RepID=A0A6A5GHV3_CAERE|nr:hypothetical protein GCK72_020816 [Caenorhabditis remanei]KAF1754256.1 hypothetical protein GCK72_020816 [Caenorhabditis remanei]